MIISEMLDFHGYQRSGPSQAIRSASDALCSSIVNTRPARAMRTILSHCIRFINNNLSNIRHQAFNFSQSPD